MNFKITETELSGVYLIEKVKFNDERGYFMEFYRDDSFRNIFRDIKFVQENLSFSKKGVIRGLHFQRRPFSQGKLISVIHGKIMDVAVNVIKDSKDFGKYVMRELSEENCRSFYIPDYFAHGFVALEDSYVLYKTTQYYNKESESGIRFDDPDIDVKWNMDNPVVSGKDLQLPLFKELIKKGDYF
jgi:dTDP-4-dehydrorhamnose 3,5-epimerase